MKIQDLRIGNLVYDSSLKELTKVGYLGRDGIGLLVKGCERVTRRVLLQEMDLEGIPLSEEWLLKMGFKPFCKDFAKNGIIVHKRKRGFVIRKSVPIMEFVHQLQNFYFTNAGEELEISL